ncbi:MAG: radical SAM-associated putative lipoprotein [Paludibacteraceae bacterium]
MKKVALKTYGKIISIFLSFFGFFFGCTTEPMYGVIAEYGAPSADYKIKGKITDATTQKPIKNIRVVIPYKSQPMYGRDTTYTNADGEYEAQFNDFPNFAEAYQVIASDPDGIDNDGLFKSDTLDIQFSKNDLEKKGDGNWYVGTYQKNNQNFSLHKEEIAPMYGVMGAKYKDNSKQK